MMDSPPPSRTLKDVLTSCCVAMIISATYRTGIQNTNAPDNNKHLETIKLVNGRNRNKNKLNRSHKI